MELSWDTRFLYMFADTDNLMSRFMQSDPWWSFAMAVNVYMVFFMSLNPTSFRQYLWVYCVICFGLPSVPSFVFLFVRQDRGLVYGDAAVSPANSVFTFDQEETPPIDFQNWHSN